MVATTLKAMERVQEIKFKRENAFWKNRYVLLHVGNMFNADPTGCLETKPGPVKKMLRISNDISNSSNPALAKTPPPTPLPIWQKRRGSGKRSKFEQLGKRQWRINSSNPNLRVEEQRQANLFLPRVVGWVCRWIRLGLRLDMERIVVQHYI